MNNKNKGKMIRTPMVQPKPNRNVRRNNNRNRNQGAIAALNVESYNRTRRDDDCCTDSNDDCCNGSSSTNTTSDAECVGICIVCLCEAAIAAA
jgi:hypothetical protein